jgi:hypothetical protein
MKIFAPCEGQIMASKLSAQVHSNKKAYSKLTMSDYCVVLKKKENFKFQSTFREVRVSSGCRWKVFCCLECSGNSKFLASSVADSVVDETPFSGRCLSPQLRELKTALLR